MQVLNKLRFLLFPIALLYGGITMVRNLMFDWGIFSSKKPDLPTIGVGNLAMGGTGKSVVVMDLIKRLQPNFKIGTLSRGYGRKTKGLIIAGPDDDASTLGDEPNQFRERYTDSLVVVSENRNKAIQVIQNLKVPPDKLILDDVMQHRWVHPRFLIMTTAFDRPYFKDFLFPVGNLRERRSGVKRADLILVTRTPEDFTTDQKQVFLKKIKTKAPVFFTKITYANFLSQKEKTFDSKVLENGFLLITGIADPSHLVGHLKNQYGTFDHLRFKDHHNYNQSDAIMIKEKAKGKIILTTEKDYAKLAQILTDENLYCIKIEQDFIFEEEQTLFVQMIQNL